MEHSKWKSCEVSGGIWLTVSGSNVYVAEALGATIDIKAKRAAFIVTACNDYDTLKAKADLLDEFVKRCEALLDGFKCVNRIGEDSFVVQSLITTLKMAKDLK